MVFRVENTIGILTMLILIRAFGASSFSDSRMLAARPFGQLKHLSTILVSVLGSVDL